MVLQMPRLGTGEIMKVNTSLSLQVMKMGETKEGVILFETLKEWERGSDGFSIES